MRIRLISSIALLGTILTVQGCSSGGGSMPAPSDPEGTVRAFMNAVNANSIYAMGELWGGRRGPARTYMPPEEVERRLTVMRIYLEHEEYEILPPGAMPANEDDQRIVRMQITRRGCQPVIPVTLTRFGDGWLVSNVDLAAAGNPART